jgi:two-component system, LytTR family, sensor histidine kinase AgrC
MIFTYSNIIYLITNIFATYVLFKYMSIFFERKNVNKKWEITSYLIYFIINSALYLFVNNPTINLISTIAMFIGITLNYKSTFKKKISATLLIFAILVLIELAVALLFGYTKFSAFSVNEHFASVPGWFTMRIIAYVAVLLMGNYKNIKSGGKIPTNYWLAMMIIPFGTIYMISAYIQISQVRPLMLVGLITLMFFINIVAFSLYNSLSNMFKSEAEKTILEQQNKHFLMQFELIKKSIEKTKSLQHDLKKHSVILDSFIRNNEKERALDYLGQISNILDEEESIANSGNIAIDSIVNFKLHEAKLNDIDVSLKLKVPSDLKISDFDITVVLGNVIDNAIIATSKLKANRRIDMSIKYLKEMLLIHLENTFDGDIHEKNNEILTLKTNKEHHGYGLKNIKHVLSKYDGIMEIYYSNKIFTSDIMMYVGNNSTATQKSGKAVNLV